ncbi:hypothetical protein GCM10010507_57230 [Streptomyces cinnamoneus]|uniref:Uncharacterized protein n=1 Tax=Streptomyces cinnamoneus TaxID=53446 RepID=A0A918WR92_STRCJ|nr:hypothetical protein GCM10010507_57230 [Streptomyces cinnamoneus]
MLPSDPKNHHVRAVRTYPLGLLPLPVVPAPLPRYRSGRFPFERAGTRTVRAAAPPRTSQKGA